MVGFQEMIPLFLSTVVKFYLLLMLIWTKLKWMNYLLIELIIANMIGKSIKPEIFGQKKSWAKKVTALAKLLPGCDKLI